MKKRRGHRPYPPNRKGFTNAEVRRVLAAAKRTDPPWLYALLRTQYELGARVTEVLHLRPRDVNWRTRTVSVARLKKSNATRNLVSDALLEMLRELGSGRDKPFFAGRGSCKSKGCPGGHVAAAYVYRRFVVVCRKAGRIPEGLWKTHALRHAAISRHAEVAKEDGHAAQLKRLQRFAGHKTISTMLGYIHVSPERQAALDEAWIAELEEL